MRRFAANTSVPIEKTKGEIESVLTKYGAREYASGWDQEKAQIYFSLNGKRIKFTLRIPHIDDQEIALNRYGNKNSDKKIHSKYNQVKRQKWRALLLNIKAKLEAVDSGITSFEEEFLPHFVVPDSHGKTVGQILIPQINQSYREGKALPPLLESRA